MVFFYFFYFPEYSIWQHSPAASSGKRVYVCVYVCVGGGGWVVVLVNYMKA